MKNKEDKKKEVKLLSSIITKIILTTVVTSTFAVTVCLFYALPLCREALQNSVQSFMLDTAVTNSIVLDNNGKDVEDLSEFYSEYLKTVKITGVDSSYAYLVNSDGTMLYHPTSEKIGKPVENEVITDLVKQINQGIIPEDNVVTYIYEGKTMYAGYAITDRNEILVVTADKNLVGAPIDEVRKPTIVMNVCVVLLCALLGSIIAFTIARPINKLRTIIHNTGNFNFRHNPDNDIMCKRHDETGAMARAIRNMRRKLREMVNNIDNASISITNNANELQKVSNTIIRETHIKNMYWKPHSLTD